MAKVIILAFIDFLILVFSIVVNTLILNTTLETVESITLAMAATAVTWTYINAIELHKHKELFLREE